jgi:hypothetical protein
VLLQEDQDQKFDFDLIVIGGGSGGLAASKEAAILNPGAKVRQSKRGSSSSVFSFTSFLFFSSSTSFSFFVFSVRDCFLV